MPSYNEIRKRQAAQEFVPQMQQAQAQNAELSNQVAQLVPQNAALQQYMDAMRNTTPGQLAGRVLEDQQRMAQMREAQYLQDEANALAAAGRQQEDMYGELPYDELAAQQAPAAATRADYARQQAIAQGLPDPATAMMQNDKALQDYIAVRGGRGDGWYRSPTDPMQFDPVAYGE